MAEFWVARLNGDDAAIVWPKVADMLAPAIAGAEGLCEPEDVHARVTQPDAGTAQGWSLWIVCEREQILGAWVTKVQIFPRARVLEIAFAGGAEMARWYETALSETEKFAREIDCRRLRAYGRRGWGAARFGGQLIGHIHERRLGDL